MEDRSQRIAAASLGTKLLARQVFGGVQACTASTDRVAILFWIEWFSAAWQEELVPGTC